MWTIYNILILPFEQIMGMLRAVCLTRKMKQNPIIPTIVCGNTEISIYFTKFITFLSACSTVLQYKRRLYTFKTVYRMPTTPSLLRYCSNFLLRRRCVSQSVQIEKKNVDRTYVHGIFYNLRGTTNLVQHAR